MRLFSRASSGTNRSDAGGVRGWNLSGWFVEECLVVRVPDQFDREAFGAAFFRITHGVLNVADIVDYAIEAGVRVSADVHARVDSSDLSVERVAERHGRKPAN